MRSLIHDYLGIGGQAKILEHARARGLHYPGLNRQKLSEQLSRYRLGPTWEMTELIITCLPDSCDTASIRALAAGWYQCARGQLPHGYKGPVSRPPGKPGQPNVPESEPSVPVLQRRLARLQERLYAENLRHIDNLRTSEKARNQALRHANQLKSQFHQTREELLRLRTITAEIATIREEYARQCVALELIATPDLRAKPIIDLPDLPATRRRIRFGVLVATIDATAPPTVTTDILAGRRIPTTAHATRLAAVLNCEPDTLHHLTNAATSATAVDEDFWTIANTVTTTPSPDPTPSPSNLVGSDPDNRGTHPHTNPTTPPPHTIADRLRHAATLHQQGLISDHEHAEQRARILAEL